MLEIIYHVLMVAIILMLFYKERHNKLTKREAILIYTVALIVLVKGVMI